MNEDSPKKKSVALSDYIKKCEKSHINQEIPLRPCTNKNKPNSERVDMNNQNLYKYQ